MVLITREWIELNVTPRYDAVRGDARYHGGIDINHDGVIDIVDVATFSAYVGSEMHVADVTGEINITGFKVPWVSWDWVAQQVVNVVGAVVTPVTDVFGNAVYVDYPIRLTPGMLGTTTLTLTVYGSPIGAAAIAALVGIIAGLLVAGFAVLFFAYVEKGAVLLEVAKTAEESTAELEDVKDVVEEAYAAGKIDEATMRELIASLDSIIAKISEAGEKAEKAGVAPSNWFKFLEPVMEMLPMIFMFALIISIMGMIPRPRRD